MSNNNEASRPKIEVRSIDYVPRHERHGKVWHQAPFWFTGNFVLTTMVTGFTGPALGLGALAVLLGALVPATKRLGRLHFPFMVVGVGAPRPGAGGLCNGRADLRVLQRATG